MLQYVVQKPQGSEFVCVLTNQFVQEISPEVDIPRVWWAPEEKTPGCVSSDEN